MLIMTRYMKFPLLIHSCMCLTLFSWYIDYFHFEPFQSEDMDDEMMDDVHCVRDLLDRLKDEKEKELLSAEVCALVIFCHVSCYCERSTLILLSPVLACCA